MYLQCDTLRSDNAFESSERLQGAGRERERWERDGMGGVRWGGVGWGGARVRIEKLLHCHFRR